jgi:protoheme IX farnesyltransferase
MAYRKDYAHAGFPMLPVNVSMQRAAWWVAIHTLLTGFVAIILGFHPALGLIYLVPVILFSVQYMVLTFRLVKKPEGKMALSLFKYSNIYLSIVQLIIIFLPLLKMSF